MILKKLSAIGFKSFADRMDLEFGPGITGVVGPNGCGKSNVVDAIKWVLGEQSAKSLRGKQMLDVIFNGSGTRKSSGMAQVDLTFDNSDGLLPTDQQEVVVSRRLYRSGESEYLLNKQVCRLRDVRELFLDTGIGVDAYSVIEQGRVDVLLQSSPADRRVIFEEAAGINKYKVRRKEAQRRLERVDQNLLRLQDIIDEVEKRLRSVKLAAGKARSYQGYVQRLRELRSRYALAEYHRLRVGRDELEREVGEHTDQSTGVRTELSNLEARSSEANVRIVDLDRAISNDDARLLTVQSQMTGQEERLAASQRRIEDQAHLLARSNERLTAFDGQVSALDQRIEDQRAAIGAIESELQGVHGEAASRQERDRALADECLAARTQLEDEKAGILELLRRTSQLNNEIHGLGVHQESLATQKDKLDARGAAVASELAETMGRRDGLRGRLGEIERLVADQKSKLDETTERLSAVSEQRARLIDQHAAAKEYRSGLHSRRQLLEEMDRKHEGLLAAAREVLARRDADPDGTTFGYVLGAVGELFEADMAHASLVEAVLGAHEQFLVVAERERLLADREILSEFGGRIRAFCLDATPPAIGGPDLSGQEGFIARLIDWVRYPAECERLARRLLGRTYVVESLEDARRLAQFDQGGSRFVTMDGVVWDADGRLGLGSLGSSTGLISRRSELRELARNLAEVDERIADLARRIDEHAVEAGHLEQVQRELREAMYTTSANRIEARAQLDGVEQQVAKLSEEQPLIATEVSILRQRLEETQRRREEGRRSLAELEQRSRDRERAVAELQGRLDALTGERAALGEEITSLRVRAGELSQRRAAAAESVRELEASRIALQAQRDRAARDVVEAQERIEQSNRQIEQARETLASLKVENESLVQRLAACRQEREDQRAAVDECAAETRRLRGELEQIEARLHERQIKLQEVRVRLEDLVARIAGELSVDLEAQYADYVPQEQEDWPAVEAEIEDLRGKIERLGNVNLDAISEQAELESREQFLTGQANDLRESQRQLLSLIERLNEESQKRFMDTFAAVQVQFSALFKKLFGGGKAELTLQDPADVLECGIDIMARPPGKELQSISLLSGGEKTLTAIALLLAVFRSRPSPFVLLDEVDAALDEANNVRFNHVVQEFAARSQFIIITHSKRTMSIADVIYGITMQEAGVSKRVSVRFDEGRDQQTAVA